MIPEVWGKHMWFSIHFIALDYPDKPTVEDMTAYTYFFENLWKVLPCYKCAENYKKHLEQLPINVTSKKTLFTWTVEFHNLVNKLTHKPLMSVDEAFAKYTDPEFNRKVLDSSVMMTALLRDNEKPKRGHIWIYIIIFLIGMLFGALIILVNKNKRYK